MDAWHAISSLSFAVETIASGAQSIGPANATVTQSLFGDEQSLSFIIIVAYL